MMPSSTANGDAPRADWGAPARPVPRALVAWGSGYAAVVIAISAVLALMTQRYWVGLIGIAIVAVGAAAARRESSRALGALGGRAIRAGDPGHARLLRLVAGIAGDLDMEAPRLLRADVPGNAWVAVDRSGPVIAVSADLESDLALTELEALTTHCICRLRDGLGVPGWARLVPGWSRAIGPCAAAAYDVDAAALTRYPPGLARAIAKARPDDGRAAALSFVPAAEGACSPSARSAALEDL